MNDIHRSDKRIEWSKASIQKRFSPENAKTVCRFLTRLKLENKSLGRIANYADCCIRILRIDDTKNIKDWNRDDIERIHEAVTDSGHANSVKKGTLSTIKRIYHFAVHDAIPDKNKGQEYDPLVSWITPGAFRDRYEKITSVDLLTGQEILSLVRAVKEIGGRYVRRNIAIVFVMLEGAYRPGELFNIRIDGIKFHDDFVRISTTGKTGPKSLALVASYEPLQQWLADHPHADDPKAYLLYEDKTGIMDYVAFRNLLQRASKKAGIKKRVWPYLFRHTSLTEYSKKLGNIVKVYGNWSARSNALSVYEHLANSDQEDAILSLHGLKTKPEESFLLISKLCPECRHKNTPDKSHCIKCGTGLSDLIQSKQLDQKKKVYRTVDKRYASKISELERLVAIQQEQIEKSNKLINDIVGDPRCVANSHS